MRDPPPSPGQHLSHQYTQTSFTPWHTEKKKPLVLHPGARGERRQPPGTTRGLQWAQALPRPRPVAQRPGGGAYSSRTLGTLSGQVLGSSALPCSQHRTLQRRSDLNNVLSTPTPLQALGWGLFLSVFAFIFSCKNSQAACPVKPRWVDSSYSRALRASHLTCRLSLALWC